MVACYHQMEGKGGESAGRTPRACRFVSGDQVDLMPN